MFKIAMAAVLISLLAACSASPTYRSSAVDSSSTAEVGPPRSPGEGPSFNPYYGAAGF